MSGTEAWVERYLALLGVAREKPGLEALGRLVHSRYDLRPAGLEALEAAYQRHQVAGATWVVGNLTMVRCTEDAVYRLRDDELVSHGVSGKRVERLQGPADYRRVAAEVFGLPGLPVEDALATLEAIRDGGGGRAGGRG